jgi:predicted O-methyltransferase YrrM
MDRDALQLLNYCIAHTTLQPPVLYDLERETYLKTLAPQMASGHLQGQFLRFVSKMKQPSSILEIGTFTGYSAICLASGLKENGVLHTIEVNEELEAMIRKYIELADLKDKITLHIGDAKEIIPKLNLNYDIVFIDAGKNDYDYYYDLVFDNINSGGLIIADNVLWSGKVMEKKPNKDASLLDAFNKKIHADERVENILLPIRDGLLLARKI